MKVKAKALGFYDNARVKEGTIFDVPKNLFSKKWMVEINAEKEAEVKDRPIPKLNFNPSMSGSKKPVTKDVL